MRCKDRKVTKPEKKDLYSSVNDDFHVHLNISYEGYNRACVEWEEFLPSMKDIKQIIEDSFIYDCLQPNEMGKRYLAKLIATRIGTYEN